MLQFDEYKVKLNNLLPQLDDLEKALNLESAAQEVDFLEAQSAADGFWDNPETSQKVLQKLKQRKGKLESQAKRRSASKVPFSAIRSWPEKTISVVDSPSPASALT